MGITLTGNKVLVIRFNETITMTSTAASLKNAVKLSKNGDHLSPTYTGLALEDKVVTKKNTLEITFATQVNGDRLRIQIDKDALRDRVSNKNNLLTTAVFSADSTSPYINSIVKVSDKVIDRVFNIRFSERALIHSNALKDPEKLAELKSKITFTTNGNDASPTYNPLDTNDTLTFKNGVLTIRLANAINGTNNLFKFAAGAFKDLSGNLNAEMYTSLNDCITRCNFASDGWFDVQCHPRNK
jgi:hypothetical protein